MSVSMCRCCALENRCHHPKSRPRRRRETVGDGRLQGERQGRKAGLRVGTLARTVGDKPSIVLVFTEKDHSKDKKPDFNAGFGKFGSALIVSLHEEGDIFGCEVAHTALKHQNFSSIGKIMTNDFEYADGQVKGELTTDGQADVFGETWEVNVKFVAPLGEIPKEFKPAPSKDSEENATDNPAAAEPTAEFSEKAAPKPSKDQLNVKNLALTKDAADVEYKQLVEQLSFKSKTNVKAYAANWPRISRPRAGPSKAAI
jgi:hypothetical protein